MLLVYQLPVILSTRFGIDIWIWLRSVFGVKGVKIISVLVIIVNFPWYAVCCDLFAKSMINLASAFGVDPAMLPPGTELGLELLCVVVGTALAWSGVKTIGWTTRILVPLLLTVGIFVVVVAFRNVPFSAIWNYAPSAEMVAETLPGKTPNEIYLLALEANFAFVITLVGGMAGVPRQCKSEKAAYYAGVLGQGVAGSFFVIIGAVMMIAMQYKGFSNLDPNELTDPTRMLSTMASPIAALASLLLVAFANIGTQAVGSYLYGVTLKSSFQKISYHKLILILCAYVAVLCIWGGVEEHFGTFLTITACVYAPLAALLFVDFFFVRRQGLDFRSAYEMKGHTNYVYTHGFNLVGIIVLAIGFCLSLLVYDPISGTIHSHILFKLTPTGFSLIGTGVIYFLISKFPPIRRYLRKDTAVSPITKPFDRYRVPPRQNIFMLPFIHLICWFLTAPYGLKIKKVNMEGIKPPYLVLGSHHSFTDFYVTPLALFPHRANYISELEGFEYYGEWIYREIGCLGTRKFVSDPALVKNIKRVLDRGDILVLYPEARYANVGTNSELPFSVVKLLKFLKVPVVILNMHGNYLQSPIWNLTHRKEARLSAELSLAFTAEEIQKASPEEIYEKISSMLTYDEYAWQRDQKMKITYDKRAEGLHKPLYRCRCCNNEESMASEKNRLFCKACGSEWTMDEYGTLHQVKNRGKEVTEKNEILIPDWYEWERETVNDEILRNAYELNIKVQIDALPNSKNFIDCGYGTLIHKPEGFTLRFKNYESGQEEEMFFASLSMNSIHTEYDYRGKGESVTLSTPDNTYFFFPAEGEKFHATKIQFAVEQFFKDREKEKNKK